MKRQLLILAFFFLIVSCGWNHTCVKPKSYNIGEEKMAAVGSEMVKTGCFGYRWEPTGLINKHLMQSKAFDDEYGQPLTDKELLYAGREGDVLHITYREYSTQVIGGAIGSYARQPFFQQLFYDLKASDKIVFQDWEIQIIDATNQQIKFKVIKE